MKCRTVERRLAEYRAGHLDEEAKAKMDDHLGACGTCRRLLTDLDMLDLRLAGAMKRHIPSADFASRVARALPDATWTAKPTLTESLWFRRISAIAAIFLLLVGAGVVMLPPHKPADPSSPAPTTDAARPALGQALPFYEPAPGRIGQAFVITRDGPKPYKGRTAARIHAYPGGTPQLVVEAFPD